MVDWRSSFAIGSFSKAMSPCLVAIFPPYEDTTLKIMIVGDLRPLLSPRRFLPYGTARTTPLPSCGDPARVRRRGQRAPAGGPETADTMARWWLGLGHRSPGTPEEPMPQRKSTITWECDQNRALSGAQPRGRRDFRALQIAAGGAVAVSVSFAPER